MSRRFKTKISTEAWQKVKRLSEITGLLLSDDTSAETKAILLKELEDGKPRSDGLEFTKKTHLKLIQKRKDNGQTQRNY